MARRRIGQEDLIARPEARAATVLTKITALLDWTEIDCALVSISAAVKVEPGWPPLTLFRALLLATWHDLPDVRHAGALDDCVCFCGFAAHEPTPERAAFVRFRRELVPRGLDRALFAAVTRQLEAKGVTVCAGTLVDATLVPSASIRRDAEAKWAGHRRPKPVHGYKAYVATDEVAGLVRGVEVTTAKRLEAHNARVQRVRCRVEKVFGTWKRSCGLRRMRWLGLAKAGLQVRLAAMAYNLHRTLTFLRAATA